MHPVLEMFTILDVEFEGRLLEKTRLRAKQFTCLFLMLTSVLLGFSFLPRARAQMHVFQVSPSSGNVGTNVTVTANLTTTNGAYNVTFNGAVLAVGTAVGNSVTASFLVPEAAAGISNITVIDVSTLEKANASFTVTTAYFLNVTVPPTPAQFQEGNSVPVSFNVTGDNATLTEITQIQVQDPTNSNYTDWVNLTTSDLGSGSVTVYYPGSFTSGATTKFVGIYTVSSLSNSSWLPITFTVGLTNSTEYHRMQTVNVMATGYQSSETVTLNITGTNVQYTVPLTANPSGEINFSGFAVPTNATVGTYTVNIVSTSAFPTLKPKSAPDTQDFTVPGFAFNATALNLAGDVVPDATLQVFENVSNVFTSVLNQTTGSNGLGVLMLEIGSYSWEGYFQGVNVGEGTFDVNNTVATNLLFKLTDLGVRVVATVNDNEVGIPEAGVKLTPASGTPVTLTTDVNGNAEEQSLLPNVTYTLSGSRYGTPFKVTNIIPSQSSSPGNIGYNGTISSLLVNGTLEAYFNVTIACPVYALQIQAYRADGQPFSNATVEASELVGGINYDGNTGSNGTVTFYNATFGEYYVQVLDSSGTLLNSTTVDLFQDQNATVNCNLFGLSISVTVTDYLGQAFANTKVTLQGNGIEPISSRTQANGTVTFTNLIGSSYSISVYLSDKGSPAVIENLLVDGSTTVSIKMTRYVLLAGVPIEVSQLAAVLIIVLSVLFILLFEVYRRRRNKHQKTDG